MPNKTVEILQHQISYYYHNGQDMSEHEQEYVAHMITEGYNQGELNASGETRGWWKIVEGS